MRSIRSLSITERWDLGLLLAMLIVACLCLTALAKRYQAPLMYAADNQTATSENPAKLEFTPAMPTLKIGKTDPGEPAYVVEEFIEPAPKAAREFKFYNGKKFQYVKTLRLKVTAYAADPRCTFPYDGTTTASGLPVTTNRGNLVAADTDIIPMHSLVSVPGYNNGAAVPVLDRGSAIKGHRLDILLPTFDIAKQWGVRTLEVKVYAPIK